MKSARLDPAVIPLDCDAGNGERTPPQVGLRPRLPADWPVEHYMRTELALTVCHQGVEFTDRGPGTRTTRMRKHDQGWDHGGTLNPAVRSPLIRRIAIM